MTDDVTRPADPGAGTAPPPSTGPLAAPRRPLRARVTWFDPDAALGAVETLDGVTYPFHAVAIADGSRHVAVGVEVVVVVGPGLPGRYEVRYLDQLGGSSPSPPGASPGDPGGASPGGSAGPPEPSAP